ncbi:phage tail protein [Longispora albida]|uniref:phage tail protein n=1 Tax=Longispora albida TaxID=203523 RepID=UPI0003777B06|nr:phage tail protein [Longispora albida]
MTEPLLVQSFRFAVSLHRSGYGEDAALFGTGGFAECSGLMLDADVKEYLEGGFNDGVVRRVGRVKLQPLVLKRGMIYPGDGGYADNNFWAWLTRMVRGELPIVRCDGHIRVSDPANVDVVAHWAFVRGLPMKVSGPTLNAKTGEIAMEELHIAHEGLTLEASP